MAKATSAAKVVQEAEPALPMNDAFEQMRQEDARPVKGVFQDNEVRGGNVHFYFRKWKGDPITEYRLYDGQEYELPLAVVKHLNSGCFYIKDAYLDKLTDHTGMPMKNPNPKKNHRFSFKISEYL